MGQSLAEMLMPERYRNSYQQGFQHFLKTGESNVLGRRIELIGQHRVLGEFPIEMAVSVIHTDKQIYFTATLRDITEAKRAEATLQEGRELAEQENQVNDYHYSWYRWFSGSTPFK